MIHLESLIRDVPDFPKKGIIFKDITPLLASPKGLSETVDRMIEPFRKSGVEMVCGIESRGFIFGSAAAIKLGAGFAPIRKAGKLPWRTVRQEYELEYGTDTIEMHEDALRPGMKVLMMDDLLATGGTMAASCKLVKHQGAKIVGVSFVVELAFLHGRDKLSDYLLHSLIEVGAE